MTLVQRHVPGVAGLEVGGQAVAVAALPGDGVGAVPVLVVGIGVAVGAFLAHPAPFGAKLASSEGVSVPLLGLAAVGAVPLAVYAWGQLAIHLGSGPGDEHYAFGHGIIMAAVALIAGLAFVAALKVSGWRVPLWLSGLTGAGPGLASLVMSTASQLSAGWALAAVAWGVGFVAAGEREARR